MVFFVLLFIIVCVYLLYSLKNYLINYHLKKAIKNFNFEKEKESLFSILENYGFNNRRCKNPYCNGVLLSHLKLDGEVYLECYKCLLAEK